eukprot:jgi/Bigna1/90003/estExt_fgenesh1_pg.C_600026
MWRFRLHRYAGDEKGVVANDEAPKYAVETLQTFELISVLKRDNRLVTVPMLKPEYRGDEDYFRFVSKEEYRPCVIQPGKYFYIQNCASNQFLTVSDDGGEIRCESREGKVDGTLFLVGVQKKQQQQQQRDNHWWFRGCKTSTSITSYGLRCIIVGPDGYLVHGFPKIVRGYLRKKNVLYGYSTKYFAIVNGELRFWEDEKHFIDCVDVARESGSLSLKDVDWATFGKTKSHVKLLFENGKTHYRFKLLKSGNIDENPFTKIKKNTAALWISSFCKLVLKINNKKQKKQPQQRDGHVVAINNENGEEKGEGEGGGGGGGGGVLAILTSEKESATSTTSFSSMSGNTIDVTKDLQQFIVDGVLRIRPCESWCELFQDINKQLIGSELLVIRLTKGEGKSRCFSYYYYSLADLQAGIMVEEVLKHQQQRNDDKEHKNHHHHPDERGDEKANHVTSDLLHHRPTEEMVIIDDDDDVKNDGDKDQRGGYTDNPHPPPPAKYRSKDGNEKEKEEEVRTSEMGGGKLTGRLRQHTSTEGEEQSRDDITRRRNRLRKDPNDNNHDRGNSLHDVTGQSTQRKGGLNTTMTTTTTTTRTCKTVITNEAAAGNDDEEQKENDKRGPRSKDDAHETKRNVKDKKEGCDKKMRHNDENRRRRRRRPTLVVESETTTRRRRDNEIDDFNNDDDNDEYTAAQTNKAQPFISPFLLQIASSRSSGQNQQQQIKAPKPSRLHLDCGGLRGEKGAGEKGRGGGGSRHKDRNIDQQEDLRQNHQRVPTKPVKATSMPVLLAAALLPTEHDNRRKKKIVMAQERRKKCDLNLDNTKEGQGQEEDKNHDKGGGGGGGGGGEGKNKEAELIRRLKHRLSPLLPFSRRGKGGHKSSVCMGWYTMLCIDANLQMGDNVARPVHLKLVILDNNTNNKSYDNKDLCKIWGLQLSLAIDLGATTLRHCKNKVQQQQHLPLPLSPASSAFQCFPLILEMRTTTTPKRAFNATGDRGNACICCSGMLVVYGRLGYASFSGAIGVTRIVPLASIESAFAEESSGLTTMISTMSCGGDGGQWYSRLVVKMKGSSGGGESSLVFRSQATSITQKASDCITSLIANKRQQPPNYGLSHDFIISTMCKAPKSPLWSHPQRLDDDTACAFSNRTVDSHYSLNLRLHHKCEYEGGSMTIKKDKSFITEASSLRVGLSRRSYSKSSSSSSSSSSTMMMRNDGKVSADASSPTATTSTTSLLSADAHLRLQMMELATIASALGIVLLVGFDCMVMRNAQEHQEEQGGRERNLDTLPFTQVLVSISQASITATCITIVVAFWLCTLALFPTASEDEVREEEEGKEDGDNKQMKLQQEEKKK